MNKIKAVYVVVSLSFLFHSCSESMETPALPVAIFELIVHAAYQSPTSENWILLHDVNGELIDYTSFKNGDNHVFNSSKEIPNNKISVTIINHNEEPNGRHNYVVTTDLLINAGSQWTLSALPTIAEPDPVTMVGKFNLVLTADDMIRELVISDRTGSILTATSEHDDLYESEIPFFENSGDILVAVETFTGEVKHKFLNGVAAGDQINLSFDDMDNYDQTFEINFPHTEDAFAIVIQRFDGRGFDQDSYHTSYGFGRPRESLTLGYIDELTRYVTLISLQYPGYEYYYSNIGGLPTNTTYTALEASFNFTNTTLYNLSGTFDSPYMFRQSNWMRIDDQSILNWTVTGPDLTHRLGSIPAALQSELPYLNDENLTYYGTAFQFFGEPYNTGNRSEITGDVLYGTGERGGVRIY